MKSSRTVDKRSDFKARQQRFQRSRKAEIEYAKKLRSVARQVGHITNGFAPNGVVGNREQLIRALNAYASLIEPWARSVAETMLADIRRRDESMWNELSNELGIGLREEIEKADTGQILRAALEAQVHLITSLPREAAERVHKLTLESLIDSTRASEIAKEIARTGEVTKSRANLIARTEVARTAAELTRARSQAVGVTHYVWRTSGDRDVRESHKHMNGKVIAWDKPPEVEPGKRYHAGEWPNCRCYAEVIISEED